MSEKNDFWIIDMGSLSTRVGYGGQQKPRYSLPTCIGVNTVSMEEEGVSPKAPIGDFLNVPQSNLEIQHIYNAGKILDFQVYQKFASSVLSYQPSVQPQQTSVILTEDNVSSRNDREKLCNIFFDKFNFKAVLFSNVAILKTFAAGRSTGVMVDSGDSTTQVTIVHDGFAFRKSSKTCRYAGNTLTEQVKIYMQEKLGLKSVKSKVELESQQDLTQSFSQYHSQALYRQIKQCLFGASDNNPLDPVRQYTLPDKTTIKLNQRDVPMKFFGSADNDLAYQGVQQMVKSVVDETELDIKQELYQNIIVAGGNTLIEGYSSDLQTEVQKLLPVDTKLRVIPLSRRRESAWIGASIMSTVSSLQPFCISHTDYKEHGITLLDKKCP